jgi:hypothetical protein
MICSISAEINKPYLTSLITDKVIYIHMYKYNYFGLL